MALPRLFDFSRPGPGVSKNAPKKKRFFLFWELYFRKFFKLIQANLLYVLFSLPLVTVGLADVGLTYITRNYVREKHAFVWGDFIGTIKKNWRQALPIGLINWILEIVLIIDVYYYSHMKVESSVTQIAFTAIAILLLLICTFMRYAIPLMIVTFKLSWKQLYKNGLIFSFAAFFQNLLITLYIAAFWYITYIGIVTVNFSLLSFQLLYYIFFYPAFRAFLIQFCLFPKVQKHMIDPYYAEHPDEGHAEKRALNIPDDSNEQAAKEEAIFVDRGRTDSYIDSSKEDLPPLPKQYSEREMQKFKNSLRRSKGESDADDDGTI